MAGRSTIAVLALLAVLSVPLGAQAPLSIDAVQPLARGDSLTAQLSVSGLIVGELEETLLSGLPILIDLRLTLLDDDAVLEEARYRYRLRYDIWEDGYYIDRAEGGIRLDSLAALRERWRVHGPLPVAALAALNGRSSLAIAARLEAVLVTRGQKDRLRDWIFDDHDVDEDRPGRDRSTGFALNLNRVVSLFFGSDGAPRRFVAEGRSAPFDPAVLPREAR